MSVTVFLLGILHRADKDDIERKKEINIFESIRSFSLQRGD